MIKVVRARRSYSSHLLDHLAAFRSQVKPLPECSHLKSYGQKTASFKVKNKHGPRTRFSLLVKDVHVI